VYPAHRRRMDKALREADMRIPHVAMRRARERDEATEAFDENGISHRMKTPCPNGNMLCQPGKPWDMCDNPPFSPCRECREQRVQRVKGLGHGDRVYWNDPDGGKCSRSYDIASIEVVGDLVKIVDVDGSELECLIKELS